MQTVLADLIKRDKEKLVDRAATSLKVMFGVAYADMAQEDLEERLYAFFDAVEDIARRGVLEVDLLEDVAESVMVSPIYQGWNSEAITEEVLRVIDFTLSKQIDTDLSKPEQAEDKAAAMELLGRVIRASKDVVNGRGRGEMEKKLEKRRKKERGGNSELREASLANEAGTD